MKTTIEELKDRIAALEAEVVALKAEPRTVNYYYTQPQQPLPAPSFRGHPDYPVADYGKAFTVPVV